MFNIGHQAVVYIQNDLAGVSKFGPGALVWFTHYRGRLIGFWPVGKVGANFGP